MEKIKLIILDHDCCARCEFFKGGDCEFNCPEGVEGCLKCEISTDCKYVHSPIINNPHSTICKGNNFKRKLK